MAAPAPRLLATLVPLTALACVDVSRPSKPSLTETDPDFSCSIPTNRLYDGGVGRDGIPALSDPSVEPIGASGFSAATRVLGVVVNGEARAYPLPILWWHEIVNDRLAGTPVVVSYCPLTGSGLAFDPVISGAARNFGVSGLLFENNLIMFDRETESLWNQLLLGAQCGSAKGTDLVRIPVVETTVGRWRQLYPRSTILTDDTGFDRNYRQYPYAGYDQPDNGFTLFPSSPWSDERPPKELVLGIRENIESAAFPYGVLDSLGAAVAVNETVGVRPVLVTWHRSSKTAVGYDRTVNGQTLTFEVADSTGFTFVDLETGSEWNRLGEATAGPLAGERLAQLADAYTLFWFAWSVFYPDTQLPIQ